MEISKALNKLIVLLFTIYTCLDLYSGSLEVFPFQITLVLLISIDIGLVLSLFFNPVIKIRPKTMYLGAFFICIILSMLLNNHFYYLTALRILTIFLFLLCYKGDKECFQLGAIVLLISGLIQCIGVFFEEFRFNSWWTVIYSQFKTVIPDIRYSLITAQKNLGYLTGWTHNAGFTATYIINSIFSLVLLKPTLKPWLYRTLLIITFIALVMTGKRGQLIFLIAAFAMMKVISSNNPKVIINRIILLLLLGVFLYFIGYFIYINIGKDEPLTRVLNLIYADTGRDKTSGRMILWQQAWREFEDKPFLGMGWLSYQDKYKLEVHNTYLQVLCETGLIGFVFFFLFLITQVKESFEDLTASKYYSSFAKNAVWVTCFYFLYYLIFCFVENAMVNVEPLFALAFFIKSGTLQIYEKKHSICITKTNRKDYRGLSSSF